MSLKAQLEAIIYAAEIPITTEQMVQLVKQSVIAEGAGDEVEVKSRVRSCLEELVGEYGSQDHGIEIRQVAGGYRMSTKPEQHEMVRSFAKSLKPPIRLSLPALETLAVIAYKQPATVPEINEIRGVDSLQDHQGIPDALRLEGCQRTAEHGRVREARSRIVPGRVDFGGRRGAKK